MLPCLATILLKVYLAFLLFVNEEKGTETLFQTRYHYVLLADLELAV